MSGFRDNPALGRFEMDVEGRIVWADYRREADRLVIDHVEAPEPLRGTGAAGRLMEAVAGVARSSGEKIIPLCGYAASWLRRHPEHADLLA